MTPSTLNRRPVPVPHIPHSLTLFLRMGWRRYDTGVVSGAMLLIIQDLNLEGETFKQEVSGGEEGSTDIFVKLHIPQDAERRSCQVLASIS